MKLLVLLQLLDQLYFDRKVTPAVMFKQSKKKSGEHQKETEEEEKSIEQKEEEPEKTVRCLRCEHEVTKAKHAIQPHEHTFSNPAGYWFHLLCFSDAPGTLNMGTPTTEHSWFEGYAWSLAICSNCNTHLGWWFSGPEQFVGLISARIIR